MRDYQPAGGYCGRLRGNQAYPELQLECSGGGRRPEQRQLFDPTVSPMGALDASSRGTAQNIRLDQFPNQSSRICLNSSVLSAAKVFVFAARLARSVRTSLV